ncbi:unnamed protein product [Calypogeia fissa]
MAALRPVRLTGGGGIISTTSPGVFTQGLQVYGKRRSVIYSAVLDATIVKEVVVEMKLSRPWLSNFYRILSAAEDNSERPLAKAVVQYTASLSGELLRGNQGLCYHYSGADCRLPYGHDEFPHLDDVCAPLAHLLLLEWLTKIVVLGMVCTHKVQQGDPGFVPYGKDCSQKLYGKDFGHKHTRVNVHLDMFEQTCSFSVDKENFGVAWSNLPDGTYYPAVSLGGGCRGRARIQLVRGFEIL